MSQATISQKNQIVIPKQARQGMHVGAGDQLIVETINGVTILLPKPKKIGQALKGLFKGVYPKNYLRRERKSWAS